MNLQERELALGWMTLPDAPPLELIHAAVANKLREISIRLHPPLGDQRPVIANDPALLREIEAAIRNNDLHLYDMGGLWLDGTKPSTWCRPALEAGARLGTSNVITILTEANRQKNLDDFGELCDLAAEYKLNVAVEFVVYSQVRTLEEAVAFVRESGRRNAGVLVDSLHLSRSGGSAAALKSAPQELISIVQLCDAKAPAPTTVSGLQNEARRERLDPGDGSLPLHDFVNAIPAALPIELEVPNVHLADMDPTLRVRNLVERTRRFLAAVDERNGSQPR